MPAAPAILSARTHLKLPGNEELILSMPCPTKAADHIGKTRKEIGNILHGYDDRLIVVAGPCSIHDPVAALEYAEKLAGLQQKFSDNLCIIMRCYFEKPRSKTGWKGFIYDPYLNGSSDMKTGLLQSRKLLLEINLLGLGAGTEFLCPMNALYFADLISWGAIGARTTESQIHRELASGLHCPIGFKNSTDGNINIAINAIHSAQSKHIFCSPLHNGKLTAIETSGNENCHIILRGGLTPNYYADNVEHVVCQLDSQQLATRIMIDFSHGNSQKKHNNQLVVSDSVAGQIASGQSSIAAVMIESFLEAGRQDISNTRLTYGKSITDACIDWEDTCSILNMLSEAVEIRRGVQQKWKKRPSIEAPKQKQVI